MTLQEIKDRKARELGTVHKAANALLLLAEACKHSTHASNCEVAIHWLGANTRRMRSWKKRDARIAEWKALEPACTCWYGKAQALLGIETEKDV